MKKSLLSLAAVAAVALSANAQDVLYATGDFDASNWNPAEPVEFSFADDVYTLTIPEVSMLKVSTVKGDWPEFNAACLKVDGDAKVGENALIAGESNIVMPWKGDWTLVVNKDLTTLTLSTTTAEPTGPVEIYLRGDMNNWLNDDNNQFDAEAAKAWQFETSDGNVYLLKVASIKAEVGFKIADADWSKINYGYTDALLLDEEYELDYNGSNITLEEDAANVTFKFTLDTHSLIILSEGSDSLAGIVNENVAPVYYNLSGMQVANPTSGLYLVKKSNKVSKVYIK